MKKSNLVKKLKICEKIETILENRNTTEYTYKNLKIQKGFFYENAPYALRAYLIKDKEGEHLEKCVYWKSEKEILTFKKPKEWIDKLNEMYKKIKTI